MRRRKIRQAEDIEVPRERFEKPRMGALTVYSREVCERCVCILFQLIVSRCIPTLRGIKRYDQIIYIYLINERKLLQAIETAKFRTWDVSSRVTSAHSREE